jgi:serine/threonine protein kinase
MTKAGDTFHTYILEREIGAGGFGAVWRARHTRTNQLVALKILTGKYASGDSPRIRAEVELLAGAALTSPHVVRVIDGGVEPTPYVVMEYVDGEDLGAELDRRGALPQADVVEIAAAITDALADFERAGIIHRDLKPSNVIRAKDGTVKVADLGIAKIVGFDQVTLAGHSPMTLAYAAPEAWEGRISHASDIYAFGALLYQCLAGRAPFAGSPAELINRHRSDAPDFSALPQDTAPALRTLIERCLAKSPSDRPPNAADISERLAIAQRQIDEQPKQPAGLREPARFGPWIRQQPHPTQPWAFRCFHEETNAHATVEVHASDSLALGDTLQRGLDANPSLTPLGAERLLGTSRLMLRPGEGFAAAKGQFLFWVARDERETPTMPAVFSQAAVAALVRRYISLIDTAAAAGAPLVITTSSLSFAADGVNVSRPALPPLAPAVEPGLALADTLRTLPLDAETAASLANVRDLPALRRWSQQHGDGAFGVAREAGASAVAAASVATPAANVGRAEARVTPPGSLDARPPTAPEVAADGDHLPPPPPPTARGGDSGGRGRIIAGAAAAVILLATAGLTWYLIASRDGDDGGSEDEVFTHQTQTAEAGLTTPTTGRTPSRTPFPTNSATPSSPTPPNTPLPGTPPTGDDIDILNVINLPAPGAVIPDRSQFALTLAADTDYRWKINASEGDLIEVRVDGAPTSNIQPEIEVSAVGGQKVSNYANSGQEYFRISLIAESTNVYDLRINARTGSGEATVRVRLNPYRPIAPNSAITASLDLPLEIDRYRFEARPDDLVEVRVVAASDTKIAPRYRLTDRFGDEVSANYGSSDAGYIVWHGFVEKEGFYTLAVSDAAEEATGSYTVEVLVEPFIPYGLGQSVRGTITKPEQLDRYLFTCAENQTINITITPDTDAKIHPGYELFDIGDDRAAGNYQASDGRPLQATHTCKFDGPYYIAVRAAGNGERGGYTLLIQ